MREDQPFAEKLQALLDEREMSHRALSKKLVEEFGDGSWSEGGGAKNTSVSRWIRGTQHPSRLAMERVAKVLGVDPNVFPEWRLEVIRDELNWRHVGTARALRALRRLAGDEEA